MPMDSREHTLGFSLIELLAVLAIISILTLAGAKHVIISFNRMKAGTMLNATSRAFVQAAHFARQQAQSRQKFITLSPICGNRWDSGWIIFTNPELNFEESTRANVLLKYIPSKDITTTLDTTHHQTRYTGNGFEDISVASYQHACPDQMPQRSSEKLKHISFNPAGGAQMKNGGLVANRLIFWSREFPDMQQQVIMGAGGRLRICTPNPGNLDCRQ
jgi:type IV fimbrial biogenesis protein FimT